MKIHIVANIEYINEKMLKQIVFLLVYETYFIIHDGNKATHCRFQLTSWMGYEHGISISFWQVWRSITFLLKKKNAI